ncbi:MAG: helix-turn-helix domain-containing protein [Methylococcaceae bacterium]|jgi:hypothetical protein
MTAFAQVPIQVIQDSRLTLEQLRVLIALLSFGNKDGGSVWPKRALIAERTGMHPANISAATTALVKLGWLEKVGKGGFSKSTRYTLKMPTTVAHSATSGSTDAQKTVNRCTANARRTLNEATVARSATNTLVDSATSTVAHSATCKEQAIEQTKEQTKTHKRMPALDRPYDVPEDVWRDYLILRDARRSPLTDRALQGIRREASRAGISLSEALEECCAMGWQGFKADWIAPSRPNARRAPVAENFAAKKYESGDL